MLIFFFFERDKICKEVSPKKDWVPQLTQRVHLFDSSKALHRSVVHVSMLDVFCLFNDVSENFGEGKIFEPTCSDGSSFYSRSTLLQIIAENLVRHWYAHSGEGELDDSVVVSNIVLCAATCPLPHSASVWHPNPVAPPARPRTACKAL